MSVLPFGYRVSRTDKNVCPPFRLSRQQDRQECLSSLSVIASAGQTRMSVLPFGYRVSGTDKNVCPPFRLSRQRDRQECLSYYFLKCTCTPSSGHRARTLSVSG